MSAFFAGAVSVHKLTVHGRTSHVGLGLAAAAVGIVGNQIVARYQRHVGRRIRSATLLADAQHSWLDAMSSGGALVGLLTVALGFRWADAVAGLIVTGFIVQVGWPVTSELLEHLMDGVNPSVLSTAETARSHRLGCRARQHSWALDGRSLLVEVEGFVAPGRTLEQADALGRVVEEAVRSALPESRAVLWCPHAMATPGQGV